jgi:hypothetical protein
MAKLHECGQKASSKTPEPRVGIFWVVNGKSLIDSTPLSDGEPYGDYLTHPRGHAEMWEALQRAGAVPRDVEYEESRRGRAMYNTKTKRFRLLADKCILSDKTLVRNIMSAFVLKSPHEAENRRFQHTNDVHARKFRSWLRNS